MTLERLLEDLKEHEVVHIPIKSLDGIKCKVLFRVCRDEPTEFSIDIYAGNSLHKDKKIRIYVGKPSLTIEGLQSAIDTLDKIKFSKKENLFHFDDEEDTYEDLFISKNYESVFKDCSVCLEKTCRRTSCNHSLCLRCYLKIEKKCPICRDCIMMDDVNS